MAQSPGRPIKESSLCARNGLTIPHFDNLTKFLSNQRNNGNFSYLQRLNLSHCSIFTIHPQAFQGLVRLVELDLSRNNLHVLQETVLAPLLSLKELNLASNPWDCTDCTLTKLRQLCIIRKISVKEVPKCALPPHLLGQPWDRFDLEDFPCHIVEEKTPQEREITGITYFTMAMPVVVFCSCMIIGCVFQLLRKHKYNKRLRTRNNENIEAYNQDDGWIEAYNEDVNAKSSRWKGGATSSRFGSTLNSVERQVKNNRPLAQPRLWETLDSDLSEYDIEMSALGTSCKMLSRKDGDNRIPNLSSRRISSEGDSTLSLDKTRPTPGGRQSNSFLGESTRDKPIVLSDTPLLDRSELKNYSHRPQTLHNFRTTQLERFLDEYRGLREQLPKQKEKRDNVRKSRKLQSVKKGKLSIVVTEASSSAMADIALLPAKSTPDYIILM